AAAVAPVRLAPTMMWVSLLVIRGPRCQGQELLARARILADEAPERRGDGLGTVLLDAAQRHAQVLRLEHDPNPFRLELVLQPVGHLSGEPLLDLEVAA